MEPTPGIHPDEVLQHCNINTLPMIVHVTEPGAQPMYSRDEAAAVADVNLLSITVDRHRYDALNWLKQQGMMWYPSEYLYRQKEFVIPKAYFCKETSMLITGDFALFLSSNQTQKVEEEGEWVKYKHFDAEELEPVFLVPEEQDYHIVTAIISRPWQASRLTKNSLKGMIKGCVLNEIVQSCHVQALDAPNSMINRFQHNCGVTHTLPFYYKQKACRWQALDDMFSTEEELIEMDKQEFFTRIKRICQHSGGYIKLPGGNIEMFEIADCEDCGAATKDGEGITVRASEEVLRRTGLRFFEEPLQAGDVIERHDEEEGSDYEAYLCMECMPPEDE